MAETPITPLEPGVEMFQRRKTQPFLPSVLDRTRPVSEATEIFDTDVDEDSEFEEESPKYSFESHDGRRSQTTISTLEEISTPQSNRRSQFEFTVADPRSVEGPKGPHLFRFSQVSSDFAFENALQMSPVLAKHPPSRSETAFKSHVTTVTEIQVSDPASNTSPPKYDNALVRGWNSRQVAAWMYQSGFEEWIVDKFETHDITGAVLLDLKFEDLKELDIPSFGKRHQLWNEISVLRGNERTSSPPLTNFHDISRPCTTKSAPEKLERSKLPAICRGRKHANGIGAKGDVITPAESVSIVAIEQLMPKPHKCQKGERCAKFRKQQKLIARVREEHGFPISPEKGGHIYIAGNPGNPRGALPAVDHVRREVRPSSDAVPSVVASSDLMGPSQDPDFAPLQKEKLDAIESRDPQENVKQFLTLQHIDPPAMFKIPRTPSAEASGSDDDHVEDDVEMEVKRPSFIPFSDGEDEDPVVPHPQRQTSPAPLEMFPPLQPPKGTPGPLSSLSGLPKLEIPRSASVSSHYGQQCGSATTPRHSLRPAGPNITPYAPVRVSLQSPNGDGLYRFGTPCSEMDVPLTAIPPAPLSRDTSQSVPPNMQFRDQTPHSATQGSSTVDWRRPSFAMPRLDEVRPMSTASGATTPTVLEENEDTPQEDRKGVFEQQLAERIDSATSSAPAAVQPATEEPTPEDPVTAIVANINQRKGKLSKRTPSKKMAKGSQRTDAPKPATAAPTVPRHSIAYANTNHAGWMKKRHTRLLRHEWREHHFRLTGSQLGMHIDAAPDTRAFDSIDVDHYAVACSSLASSKLSTRLKALKLAGHTGTADSSKASANANAESQAFSFQLVPSAKDIARASAAERKLVASGKTHHFAVKTRDERIDWMRELMLAKAMRAKGEGYEVQVNGTAI